MKKIVYFILLVVTAVVAASCLKIETRVEKPLALCMPVVGAAADVTAPHTFEVAGTALPPVLLCYTYGAGLAAAPNAAYDPRVTDRRDLRHYQYILEIPQPAGPVVFALNWPHTYR